jgi:hypothetical protein
MKFIQNISVVLVVLLLSACVQIKPDENTVLPDDQLTDASAETTSVTDSAPSVQNRSFDFLALGKDFDAYVQDGNNFVIVSDVSEKEGILRTEDVCPQYRSFFDVISRGEIGRLTLFRVPNPWGLHLKVYATENPEHWNTETFRKNMDPCQEGAGAIGALVAYSDHLLWGYPSCSAGAKPGDDQHPAIDNFRKCEKVEALLKAYVASKNPVVVETQSEVESEAEPVEAE